MTENIYSAPETNPEPEPTTDEKVEALDKESQLGSWFTLGALALASFNGVINVLQQGEINELNEKMKKIESLFSSGTLEDLDSYASIDLSGVDRSDLSPELQEIYDITQEFNSVLDKYGIEQLSPGVFKVGSMDAPTSSEIAEEISPLLDKLEEAISKAK